MPKFPFLILLLSLSGCRHYSKHGLKRAETVAVHAEAIAEKTKIKDTATGELLRISQEAMDTDVREASKEALLEAYPASQTLINRKVATEEIVAYHKKQLEQSKDISMEVEKIQKQVVGIKEDFRKTLEKELKLSTIQTIVASIGGTLGILLLFNLIMGGVVSKFRE